MSWVIAGPCFATTDATCLVYQAIDMRNESTVIKLPKEGFIILAIPYASSFSALAMPYHAIARPHQMLSMRPNQGEWDSNLVSRTGIKIQSDSIFEGSSLA